MALGSSKPLVLTRAEIETLIGQLIRDNNAGEIDPAAARRVLLRLLYSSLLVEDGVVQLDPATGQLPVGVLPPGATGGLVLPTPRLELRSRLRQPAPDPLALYCRTFVRVRFDGPLPAAVLAANPEIWLFRYRANTRKPKNLELFTAQLALTQAQQQYAALCQDIEAGEELTPAQRLAYQRLSYYWLPRAAGFVYADYPGTDPGGRDTILAINQGILLSLVNRLANDSRALNARKAGWRHPTHQNGSRVAPNASYWGGTYGSGNGVTVPGCDTEFFGQGVVGSLGRAGFADIAFDARQWFYDYDGGPIRPRGKRLTAGHRFRFALVVDAPAGQGRGGKLISALSEVLFVKATTNVPLLHHRILFNTRGRG